MHCFCGVFGGRLQERRIYELPTPDKIRSCEEFKTLGNLFFKEGQFYRAAEKYRLVRGHCGRGRYRTHWALYGDILQCLVYYEYAFPDGDEEQKKLDQLRLDCLLNIANCKLKTRQYDEVIENCTQVLPCSH